MERMVIDRRINKWKNLKQRLGLKAMACCGATWSPRARISTISIPEEDEEGPAAAQAQSRQIIISRSIGNVVHNRIQNQIENNACSTPLLVVGQQQQQQVEVVATTSGGGGGSGMNLAMALAAERRLRRGDNVVDIDEND